MSLCCLFPLLWTQISSPNVSFIVKIQVAWWPLLIVEEWDREPGLSWHLMISIFHRVFLHSSNTLILQPQETNLLILTCFWDEKWNGNFFPIKLFLFGFLLVPGLVYLWKICPFSFLLGFPCLNSSTYMVSTKLAIFQSAAKLAIHPSLSLWNMHEYSLLIQKSTPKIMISPLVGFVSASSPLSILLNDLSPHNHYWGQNTSLHSGIRPKNMLF